MSNEEQRLFDVMIKAIEEHNEKELQYLIAKRDREAAIKAFREYVEK
jgi:hypothetical protein